MQTSETKIASIVLLYGQRAQPILGCKMPGAPMLLAAIDESFVRLSQDNSIDVRAILAIAVTSEVRVL